MKIIVVKKAEAQPPNIPAVPVSNQLQVGKHPIPSNIPAALGQEDAWANAHTSNPQLGPIYKELDLSMAQLGHAIASYVSFAPKSPTAMKLQTLMQALKTAFIDISREEKAIPKTPVNPSLKQ